MQNCSFQPVWVTFSHKPIDALLSAAILFRRYFIFYLLVSYAKSWPQWTKTGWTYASCQYAVLCCCPPSAAHPTSVQLSRLFPFLHGCATGPAVLLFFFSFSCASALLAAVVLQLKLFGLQSVSSVFACLGLGGVLRYNPFTGFPSGTLAVQYCIVHPLVQIVCPLTQPNSLRQPQPTSHYSTGYF